MTLASSAFYIVLIVSASLPYTFIQPSWPMEVRQTEPFHSRKSTKYQKYLSTTGPHRSYEAQLSILTLLSPMLMVVLGFLLNRHATGQTTWRSSKKPGIFHSRQILERDKRTALAFPRFWRYESWRKREVVDGRFFFFSLAHLICTRAVESPSLHTY